MVKSGAVDVLGGGTRWSALVPKAELDGEMGDSHMGLQARLMSQALRKLTGTVSKSRTCLIFINQIREKIGVMFGQPPRRPPAVRHSSSTPLCVSTSAASARVKEGDVVVGSPHQGEDRQE